MEISLTERRADCGNLLQMNCAAETVEWLSRLYKAPLYLWNAAANIFFQMLFCGSSVVMKEVNFLIEMRNESFPKSMCRDENTGNSLMEESSCAEGQHPSCVGPLVVGPQIDVDRKYHFSMQSICLHLGKLAPTIQFVICSWVYRNLPPDYFDYLEC